MAFKSAWLFAAQARIRHGKTLEHQSYHVYLKDMELTPLFARALPCFASGRAQSAARPAPPGPGARRENSGCFVD
jgi:hypothetical protein